MSFTSFAQTPPNPSARGISEQNPPQTPISSLQDSQPPQTDRSRFTQQPLPFQHNHQSPITQQQPHQSPFMQQSRQSPFAQQQLPPPLTNNRPTPSTNHNQNINNNNNHPASTNNSQTPMHIYHICPNPACKHENWSDFEGAPQSCCPYISITPTERAILVNEEWPAWALDIPTRHGGVGSGQVFAQGMQVPEQVTGERIYSQSSEQASPQWRFGQPSGLAIPTQTLSYRQWRAENVSEMVQEAETEAEAEARAEDEEQEDAYSAGPSTAPEQVGRGCEDEEIMVCCQCGAAIEHILLSDSDEDGDTD